MITIAFFNNKGGVGKTALVSHLAWMYANRGLRTLAVDLDPQSNLSSMMLTEERIQEIWKEQKTILASVTPLIRRSGDISPAHTEAVADGLNLLVGDLGLSRFEDLLAESWCRCAGRNARSLSTSLTGEVGAFRVISSFHRLMKEAAARVGAALVLIDLGSNLGPLNRAALLAADNLVLPIAPDPFSIQGMESMGTTLRDWRQGWEKRRAELRDDEVELPAGMMKPIGYVLMSFGVRDTRPVQAYDDWIREIPVVYRQAVLGEDPGGVLPDPDPYRLAALKHYRSLMPLAMTARKPMFLLKSNDGARGAHLDAVKACYDDFLSLSRRIGDLVRLSVP
jgi:cellulose biosynthesis protein BcsQ